MSLWVGVGILILKPLTVSSRVGAQSIFIQGHQIMLDAFLEEVLIVQIIPIFISHQKSNIVHLDGRNEMQIRTLKLKNFAFSDRKLIFAKSRHTHKQNGVFISLTIPFS